MGLPVLSRRSRHRYFEVRKYCGDYAVFEVIEDSGKRFDRKVADDISHIEEAELFVAALQAVQGRE